MEELDTITGWLFFTNSGAQVFAPDDWIIIFFFAPRFPKENCFWKFPEFDLFFCWYGRHWMKMSVKHVRSNIERVELKYWDKKPITVTPFDHYISKMECLRNKLMSPRSEIDEHTFEPLNSLLRCESTLISIKILPIPRIKHPSSRL
jgi:hypothetical protein